MVWTPAPLEDDLDTVLVLAGDIDVGMYAVEYAIELGPRFKAVIYVAGNHDLWKQNIDFFYDKARLRVADHPNVHILQNDKITIDDVEFLGTTLWTDINNHDPFDTWNAPNVMRPDFRQIRYTKDYKRITPTIWLGENLKARAWLADNIDPDKKQVVVTHHAPDMACAEGNECAGNGGDVYYYNRNMQDMIVDAGFWIFGHTHHRFDKYLGDTRVVSNPYGYYGHRTDARVAEFDSNGILEV
jgi:predicted phosphohydrolase